METVFNQAEEKLVTILRRIRTGHSNAGCLHIKGAMLSSQHFSQLPSLITQWIGHHSDGHIIVCHDRDVFVFSPNVSFKIFMKFREKFNERFEISGSKAEADPVSFYDVRINGAGLTELAQTKQERRDAAQKKADEAAKVNYREKQRDGILTAPLNEDMVETISRRREGRTGLNILIVEDDPFSRKLIGNSLGLQFSMTFAEDGRTAIANHLKAAPDVVFLDIDLPDITGHDVLRKIIEIDPAAYVVMLSGNGNVDNITRAVNAGAKGFVGKPFSKERLLQYINKCPRYQHQQAGV